MNYEKYSYFNLKLICLLLGPSNLREFTELNDIFRIIVKFQRLFLFLTLKKIVVDVNYCIDVSYTFKDVI